MPPDPFFLISTLELTKTGELLLALALISAGWFLAKFAGKIFTFLVNAIIFTG